LELSTRRRQVYCFDATLWERDSTPLQGDRPQGLINKQVLEKADVLVAIFWTRIGSPTGVAPGGTVEELWEHIAAQKPTLIYFSNVRPNLTKLDTKQWEALKVFREEIRSKGLQHSYRTKQEFRNKLHLHLSNLLVNDPIFAEARGEGVGPDIIDGNAGDIPGLSIDATKLLDQAAKNGGQILMLPTHDHGADISVGEQGFGDGTAQENARWEEALEELTTAGFVRDPNGKGEIFRVTKKGYTAVDTNMP
jgi:hypothetical protein